MDCNQLPRIDTILSLYDFATIIGIDFRELYGLTTANVGCCPDSYKSNCALSWTELPNQRINTMSRMNMKRRIANAEQLVANYLNYWPGMHYVEGETHAIKSMNDVIRTRWSKVAMTGTRTYTPVATALPQARAFSNPLDMCLDTCITYTIGTAENPVTDLTEEQLCRLIIMPPGYDVETFIGNRIRPFEASLIDGILTIEVPIWIMVERQRYFGFPTGNNRLEDSDACDPDIYWDTIDVYLVSYEKPDGKLILKKNFCCCNAVEGTCDACSRIEVDVCFEPIDPENGEFKFFPIVNTAADPLNDPPCWERSTWGQCCLDLHTMLPDHTFSYQLFCDSPQYVKINYLSGCGSKCFGLDCFPDGVCEDLQSAIAFLAAGLLDFICDCGCTTESLKFYAQDLRLLNARGPIFNTVYNGQSFMFGYTQGATLAWDIIKNMRKRLEYAII